MKITIDLFGSGNDAFVTEPTGSDAFDLATWLFAEAHKYLLTYPDAAEEGSYGLRDSNGNTVARVTIEEGAA